VALDLTRITLVGQDWGGLIGLRLVAEQPARFSRVVAANTGLPTGDMPMGKAFLVWQRASQLLSVFDVGSIVQRACESPLPPEVVAAYNAPFPDESYKAGARQFPLLVPTQPDDPAAPANRRAWDVLRRWDKPFLTVYGDSDPITHGADALFRAHIPGAQDQPHITLPHTGHFLQEDSSPEFARIIVAFLVATR
jgi:haloalkane dehalogenase